ncbi:hypothetical protein [Pararhodobacter sp. SW119]|uniref:hypothetical protein n=1 Tax=Pararhodobacter sp. SW119 TaxID=2780075 RepID=UPI001AE01DB4|nr:hypothetical protein [Pararhodobacter sp. SW119]
MSATDPEDRRRKPSTRSEATGRAARLKTALKANLARRKEQARARAAEAQRNSDGQENRRDD